MREELIKDLRVWAEQRREGWTFLLEAVQELERMNTALAAIEAVHRPWHAGEAGYPRRCRSCERHWPCPTERVLREMEATDE